LLETQESFRVRNTELIVEKGTSLLIPVHSVHYDPHLYPHPKLFDSSRLKAYKSNSRHPFAYLPFGTFGPRSCIGLRFGKMQAKIGIVSALQVRWFRPNRHPLSFGHSQRHSGTHI